ncbi:uncharacterized protein LOC144490857, partial [Mustelus asterias]
YHQVEIEPCKKDTDRVCGCPPGMFQKRIVEKTFQCLNCTFCKIVLQKCGGYNDTICHCEPGEYYDLRMKKCQSCDSCSPGSECAVLCSTKLVEPVILILATISFTVLVAIVLGALTYCLYRSYKKRRGPHSQSETGFSSRSELVVPCAETLLPIQEATPTKSLNYSTAVVELPDCVLVAGKTQLPNS